MALADWKFSDNCWLKTNKGASIEYFSLYIDDDRIAFTRYVVPGRFDLYCFWHNNSEHIAQVKYFTDCKIAICHSIAQFKRDLKRKNVQELIAKATQNKYCERQIKNFLEYIK
jgi:hypothetical protein